MLEKHRTVKTCNECHRKIDPLGFALENFDPIGTWRDNYVVRKTANQPASSRPIDASGRLPDGTEIKDFASLKETLPDKRDLFAATLTKNSSSTPWAASLAFRNTTCSKRSSPGPKPMTTASPTSSSPFAKAPRL